MSEIFRILTKNNAEVDCPLVRAWVTPCGRDIMALVILPNGKQVHATAPAEGFPWAEKMRLMIDDYEPPVKNNWYLSLKFPH